MESGVDDVFLKPIGEMTGSLDTYKELKEQLAR